jgi:predicted nicotinamide N-methyase
LTKYIELNPGLFSGGLVVDLGCGCGSAGVAASAAGAVATVCNDIDPLAVIAAAHNIDINQNLLGNDTRNPRGSIGSTEYYFTTKDFISGGPEALTGYLSDNVNNLKSIDATRRYLLVGDMLYDDDIGESVLRLAQTLRLAGWQVLVGDPGRHFATSRSEELGPVEAEYDLPPALLDQNNGLNRTVVRRMRSVRCTQQHRG